MVGIFENSFHLANYENSHKRIELEEENKDDKDTDEDDKDIRKKRVNKKID